MNEGIPLEQLYSNQPTGLKERRQILEWVNSLEIEECRQANSSLSFKNGVLFCLIADYIKGGTSSEFLNSVIFDTDDDNASIYNITLAWREVAEIWEDFNLNPEIVYWDEEEVFKFLKILKDLHFIIQSEPLDETNQNTHVDPVELTESRQTLGEFSSRNEDERRKNSNQHNDYPPYSEYNYPLQEKIVFDNNRQDDEDELQFSGENELNDIKEIEEELKQNLIASNSNFRNPTLEEPSPGSVSSQGPYHSNVLVSHPNQHLSQPNFGKMMPSNSHPAFLINSTTSANIVPERVSSTNPTPKNYNYALNDQISMFSSQDKQRPTHRVLNTSDIVEYSHDELSNFPVRNREHNDTPHYPDPVNVLENRPVQYQRQIQNVQLPHCFRSTSAQEVNIESRPQYGSSQPQIMNNADTLERDVARYALIQLDEQMTVREEQTQNFRSINPDLPATQNSIQNDTFAKQEGNENVMSTPDDGFSFDTKHLFKLEDLNKNTKKRKKRNNRDTKLHSKTIELPRTTEKLNKHKTMIPEMNGKYDSAKI